MKGATSMGYWDDWASLSGHSQLELGKWERDPKRQYHCIFCRDHGTYDHFLVELQGVKYPFLCCKACREYKGLEPCLKGELNCQL